MSSPVIETLEVRKRVCADLALFRSLIRALLAVVEVADERQRHIIRAVLAQLCFEVDRHHQYEKEVVLPILREVDAWGPVRVERLCKDHDEQRSALVALTEDADGEARAVEELAQEIIWFFQRFEQNIVEEEDALLRMDVIGAEPLVDQIDG